MKKLSSINNRNPHLSIVVASRNDDHGGDLLRRMQIFIHGLDKQVNRHRLRVELIIVEWNPPPDRPLLHEILSKCSEDSFLSIRYIIVPNEIHRRWKHHDKFSLYQYIAKNIGIRRAHGDFILITNVDLLFSDALCQFLATEKLDPHTMYRANRCDVPAELPDNISITRQLEYCEKNIITRYGLSGEPARLFLRGIKNKMKKILIGDLPSIYGVDTDACGDFTLMSKQGLEQIKGYPELIFHAYVDGFLCHTATACGYSQVILSPDKCTYHLYHKNGWTSISIVDKILMMQIRPFLDYTVYNEAVKWIHDNKQPLPINCENWGCANESLKEIEIGGNGKSR